MRIYWYRSHVTFLKMIIPCGIKHQTLDACRVDPYIEKIQKKRILAMSQTALYNSGVFSKPVFEILWESRH